RKPRKDKPQIDLAPNQPPTTQGHPRARVFVACIQCRGRKIRCDGGKPVCYHCSQRGGNEQCSYDALPKRRGPDRIQGARTRGTAPKDDDEHPRRRRRRLRTVEQAAGGGSNDTRRSRATIKPSSQNLTQNTSEDPVLFLQAQQNNVPIDILDPDRPELLESSVWFSPTNETLTYQSTSNEHPVSSLHSDVDGAAFHSPSTSSMPASYATLVAKRRELELCDITPDPSVQFSRKIWWDHLCHLYAVSMRVPYHSSSQGLAYPNGSISQIIKDVRFIFRSSPYWFSFLNVPRFYNTFSDPVRRSRMQPSLLLSLLAISTYLQSSERANPEESRRMAMVLRDEAQGYLEASLHARAINDELAQAAWILAFFEVCGHSQHKMTRIHSSLSILDSIIRSLAMQYLDASNPTASTFVRNDVPIVQVSSENHVSTSQHYPTSMSIPSLPQQYVQPQQIAVAPTIRASNCLCNELSLGAQWPEAQEKVPLWVATPMWNREWTEGEIRREECRRLCWSALMLVSGQTSFSEAAKWSHMDLFMVEPSNYSILFPGESLLSSHPHAHLYAMGGKDTVWALYLRAMLLWNACVRMRHNTIIGDLDISVFAMRTWMETEAIEEALNRHTCGVERAFFFHGREFLFNTRMCISYEFQRFIPHVVIGLNRKKSEEWLLAQGQRAKMVVLAMHTITGNSKNRFKYRPWFMWWFLGQILRALTLWQHDNSLTIALDVCKAFLEPIEYLSTLYPGPVQRIRSNELRERVQLAIFAAETTSG
ncbi:hypothetical protein BJV74DRAFT_760416, partial [Russula compacta]